MGSRRKRRRVYEVTTTGAIVISSCIVEKDSKIGRKKDYGRQILTERKATDSTCVARDGTTLFMYARRFVEIQCLTRIASQSLEDRLLRLYAKIITSTQKNAADSGTNNSIVNQGFPVGPSLFHTWNPCGLSL
jgi:hypothetical protein